MRRAMRHSHKLGFNKPILFNLSKSVINLMSKTYSELLRAEKLINMTLFNEEEKFLSTLSRGLKILEEESKSLQTGGIFDGDMFSVAFNVNDDLSISYSEMTATYDSQNHGGTNASLADEADVDEKHESLQAAYSMGAMSIKAYTTKVTNPFFDEDAETVTKNEIALGLSF